MHKSSHEWLPGLNKLDHESYSLNPFIPCIARFSRGQCISPSPEILPERQRPNKDPHRSPGCRIPWLTRGVLMNHHPTTAFQLTSGGRQR